MELAKIQFLSWPLVWFLQLAYSCKTIGEWSGVPTCFNLGEEVGKIPAVVLVVDFVAKVELLPVPRVVEDMRDVEVSLVKELEVAVNADEVVVFIKSPGT